MKFKDLFNKPFGEVIDEYCALYSEECGHIYGVCPMMLAEEMCSTYDIKEEDYPSISVEPLIPIQLLYDTDEELITSEKIERIMDALGIIRK